MMGRQLKENDILERIASILTEERLISCEEQISFLSFLNEEE